jgi:hypothetical protein
MAETLNILFIPAILDFLASSFSSVGKTTLSNFYTPSSIGKRPRKLIGLEGSASETPNPIMLIITIIVKPRYWPTVILRGEREALVVASAKKVTRTKRSSMLVMVKVLYAVPTDLPNYIMGGIAVGEGSSVGEQYRRARRWVTVRDWRSREGEVFTGWC